MSSPNDTQANRHVGPCVLHGVNTGAHNDGKQQLIRHKAAKRIEKDSFRKTFIPWLWCGVDLRVKAD
jgi:hypothetical protein